MWTRFHVRVVSLAERKVHAELRIEPSEVVQIRKLLHASFARADVECEAELMPGDATHSNPSAIPLFYNVRFPGAGPTLTNAHAHLLFLRPVRGCDGDRSVLPRERLQEVGG
jgi:hypothetical protein